MRGETCQQHSPRSPQCSSNQATADLASCLAWTWADKAAGVCARQRRAGGKDSISDAHRRNPSRSQGFFFFFSVTMLNVDTLSGWPVCDDLSSSHLHRTVVLLAEISRFTVGNADDVVFRLFDLAPEVQPARVHRQCGLHRCRQ